MNWFFYRLRSVFLALLALYFLFAAAVQYNDPDPLHWMALYGLSAASCFLVLFGKHWPWLFWLMLGMSLSEILIALDGFFQWLSLGAQNLISSPMSQDRPWIEQSREFLGALISAVVAGWLIKISPGSANPAGEMPKS